MKKYYYLEDLLLTYHADGDISNDLEGVKEYLSDVAGIIVIERALREGREVLSMDPFPWEWICDIMNDGSDDAEEVKSWLKELLTLLEVEAKKQGKL